MNRLTVKRLLSIGAVPEGDNPEAEIMLFKRKKIAKHALPGSIDETIDAIRSSWYATVGENGPWIDSVFETFVVIRDGDDYFQVPYTLTEQGVAFGSRTPIDLTVQIVEKQLCAKLLPEKKNVSKLTGHNPDRATNEGSNMNDLDLTGVEQDLADRIAKTIAELEGRIAELETPPVEDITKGMSDEVKAEFEKLRKEQTETVEALAKEREQRQTAEWIGKARQFEKTIGDAEEAGPHFRAMPTDTAEWLVEKLNSVEAVLAKSDLFKELGSGSDETAEAQIAALAVEKQQQNPELTPAQARALVRKERLDLREAEKQERSQG